MINEMTGWSEMKSLKLSRFLVLGMEFLCAALLICVPFISRWYEEISTGVGLVDGSTFVPVCVMLYICDVFAIVAVNSLRILLRNISAGEVFTETNSRMLRMISWCIVFAGVTFAVFGIWRFSFFFASFFALFLGLVMRVLKNVFEKAVEIKSENDFTI